MNKNIAFTPFRLLTDDEMCQITGKKNQKPQIEFLKKHKIPFIVNAQGRPIVALAQYLPTTVLK